MEFYVYWNCCLYVVDNGCLICLNCFLNCFYCLVWSSLILGYLFVVVMIYECVDLFEIFSIEDEDFRIFLDMVFWMWFLKYWRFDLVIN